MLKPNSIRRAVLLVLVLFCLHALSQTSRSLDVIDLDASTPSDQLAQARQHFTSGDAVLRVRGGGQQAAEDLLEIPHLGAAAMNNSKPSPFLGAAAYKDEHGTVRLVEAFGWERDANSASRRSPLDQWIEREQARMIARAASGGDPEPPAEAWTALYRDTVVKTTEGGQTELTLGIFRLNSTNATYDFYLVATVPVTTPHFDGRCGGQHCGWHTVDRETYILPAETTPSATGTVIDHGPTGTITSSTTGFDIGGSLSPEGPGGSVSYSASWSTPSITTTDKSDATQGEWDEQIQFPSGGPPCSPVSAPDVSTGAYLSRQAAIFEVPHDTTGLELPVRFHSHLCYADGYAPQAEDSDIQVELPLGPPLLQVYPLALTIPAGGTGKIYVSALIPGSTEGFSWTDSSDQLWATVDSMGPFSVGRVVPITIAPDTQNGLEAHISINSDPKYAAPSVRKGPLEVEVTVGAVAQKTSGGVLLSGGAGITGYDQNSQVYDYNANALFNTGLPAVGRAFHTATMLKDGRVLVVGGRTGSNLLPEEVPVTAVAEIYDPSALSYSPTGSLLAGRQQHTATRLPDGKILVTGGTGGAGPLATAELYDPATGRFSSTGPMLTSRYGHTATLMAGQPAKVFLYGGMTTNEQALTSTEVWDESTGKFSAGAPAPLSIAYNPQPEPLQNGDFVIAGGVFDGQTSTAELLIDPAQSPALLTSNAHLNHARAYGALSPLAGHGELLITGGAAQVGPQTYLNDAEVRNANGWTQLTAHMSSPRIFHTSTLLPNGKVFIAGGLSDANTPTNTTDFYDPVAGTFTGGPSINARYGQTATFFSTSMTSVSAAPSPSIAGQTVHLSAEVETPSGSSSGTVDFYDGPTPLGTAAVTDGQASLGFSKFAVGTHNLTAVYSGDASNGASTSASVTLMVTAAGTSTSLSSSVNPSRDRQTVTFSSSVQVQTGAGGTPTGTVTFKDGTKNVASVTLMDGAASFVTSSLSVGSHPISASYSGDSTHSPSVSGVVTQVVNPPGTVTTLTSAPIATSYGQTITFTSTVAYRNKGLRARDGLPTGIVSFKDSGHEIGQATLSNGTAGFQTSTLGAGPHSITATYLGSGDADGSMSTAAAIDIARAGTATAVVSSVNPSNSGQAVTFTARVTSSGGPPTGTVQFSNGSNLLGRPIALISGTANLSTAALPAGTLLISAAYTSDNGNFDSSAANAIRQVVSAPKTTTALSASPQSPVFGQKITFAATVTSTSGSTPTGSVTFNDGSKLLGHASLMHGTATLSVPSLVAGAHSITAAYAGDSANGESTSLPIAVNVSQAPTQTILTSSPNPSFYQGAVVLQAAVSSTEKGALTGKVVFRKGTDPLGTAAVTNGVATFHTSDLPIGSLTLTASYEADPNFQNSTSAPVDQVVNPVAVATTTTVSGTRSDGTPDTSITFTIQVKAASGTKIPEGTVVLKDGASPLATRNLSGGVATFSTKFKAGQHPITAMYTGNTEFTTSNSSAFMVTINALIKPEVVMVSDPNPANAGQMIKFTVTVSSKGDPAPTGSITVSEDLPDGKTMYYGSANLVNGVGLVITTQVPPGRHSITATYGGDGQVRYTGAASKPLLQVVNQP